MHITEKSSRQATTTSPSRGRTAGSTVPNQPRPIASSRVSTSARSPSDATPRRDDVVDGAGAAVDVPEPCLAAEHHHPVEQVGVVVDVEPLASGAESTMPWSATTTIRVSAGRRLAQMLGGRVDHRQLLLPLRRVDAVAVPGPVEVAVVHVGQRRLLPSRCLDRGEPLPHPVGADELGAAVAGDGEPGAMRSRACSRPSSRTPAAASRSNAVGCGCHSRGSTLELQNSALSRSSVPGIRAGEADHAVGPGVSAVPSDVRLVAVVDGTPTVAGSPRWRVQERRLLGVVAQQLVAEPVDEEHHVAAAPRGSSSVRRRQTRVDPEGRADRREDVAERPVRVGRRR